MIKNGHKFQNWIIYYIKTIRGNSSLFLPWKEDYLITLVFALNHFPFFGTIQQWAPSLLERAGKLVYIVAIVWQVLQYSVVLHSWVKTFALFHSFENLIYLLCPCWFCYSFKMLTKTCFDNKTFNCHFVDKRYGWTIFYSVSRINLFFLT